MIEVTRDCIYRTPEGKFKMVLKGYISEELAKELEGYKLMENYTKITKKELFKEVGRIRKCRLGDNPPEVRQVWNAGKDFALDEIDRFVRNLTK